jgi:hypothetical protein
MSEDAGIEPRTVATFALAVQRVTIRLDIVHKSVRSHPQSAKSHLLYTIQLDLLHNSSPIPQPSHTSPLRKIYRIQIQTEVISDLKHKNQILSKDKEVHVIDL